MRYTIQELMSCIIARELENGDKVAIGINADVFLAAALLAHGLYVPKLRIRHALHNINTHELNPAAWTDNPKSEEFKNFGYYESHDEILNARYQDSKDIFCNVFFVSGIQIDKHGNTNLIGLKDNEGKMIMRGPGSIGTSSLAQFVKKYFIFTMEHSRRRLVEKCDYVSTIGYDIRKRYGISGGPRLIITPLCIFNFINGIAHLMSVHPHSTLDEVQLATGFDFEFAHYYITKEPTNKELKILRGYK